LEQLGANMPGAKNIVIGVYENTPYLGTVKPHKGLNNAIPYEILTAYFSVNLSVNNPENSYTFLTKLCRCKIP